jgi:sugar phosphate permease
VIGFGSGIFFLGYLTLEIPGALIVERWSARKWIARIMVSWGLVTVWMAFIHTAHEFYLVRFLLGVAEAGFFPGVIVYLTHWFPREQRARSIARFMAAVPISYIVGSFIAGWLLQVHWFSLPGWRWLFILEGLPAILFGVVTWFYLTDKPREAMWLTAGERDTIEAELAAERRELRARQLTAGDSLDNPNSIWWGLRTAIGNRDVLLLAGAWTMTSTVGYGISTWLPTILKQVSGSSSTVATLLSALPYAASFLAMQVNGWHSDHTGERRLHGGLPLFIAAAAALPLIMFSPGTAVVLGLVVLVISFQNAYLPPFWAMPSTVLSETAAASAIGFINCISMLGSFAGPTVMGYLSGSSHSFQSSFALVAAGYALAGIFVLQVRLRQRSHAASNGA